MRAVGLGVRQCQCSPSGDPTTWCPNGPNPLPHLHILFPEDPLKDGPTLPTCLRPDPSGGPGAALCRAAPKGLFKHLNMSLAVTEAVSVGRGCSLLVPRQADSKAEPEDSRPRILNSDVASQVVMKVDLSWQEDRASFIYQFVCLIYNS